MADVQLRSFQSVALIAGVSVRLHGVEISRRRFDASSPRYMKPVETHPEQVILQSRCRDPAGVSTKIRAV